MAGPLGGEGLLKIGNWRWGTIKQAPQTLFSPFGLGLAAGKLLLCLVSTGKVNPVVAADAEYIVHWSRLLPSFFSFFNYDFKEKKQSKKTFFSS